ncbi:Fic family protein [Gordonibacter massiliensis (ex Traore et al. 2017)]|uniref:Fic family protein n=1 Tax=Gordonibacter massiliensis (ex Traore et al. 2017) TaxID=1841863 RepID=UPI001C8C403E|nr:Fic family protein [Gordonibacter massiliensis (ex Traore et al. 2017)]MBX9034658.1 Fic family protein [Gordonibacter massiliensis (ex Traore et al. 2017)]
MALEKANAPSSQHGTVRPLSRIELQLDNETARMLGDAELAVRSLDRHRDDALAEQAFADACLHIESIANIKMTGKQASTQHVFRTAVMQPQQKDSKGEQAKSESLRNTDALLTACELGKGRIRRDTFGEIHRHLLTGTTRESFRGQLRANAKQVGGSRYHSFGSPYRTPDPADIPPLLGDLAVFCDHAELPAVAQAALAHVQFIAIHPFERANGKTARAIIQLVFQHRGLITKAIAPLSLSMVISSHDYQKGVVSTMQNLLADRPDPQELNAWLRYFCTCCTRAVDEAVAFERKAAALQETWLSHLGTRSDSATTLLVRALPGIPVFTAASAAAYIDRSFKRATSAVDELMEAGVIAQITEGKRNRVFECPGIVDAYAGITGFQ